MPVYKKGLQQPDGLFNIKVLLVPILHVLVYGISLGINKERKEFHESKKLFHERRVSLLDPKKEGLATTCRGKHKVHKSGGGKWSITRKEEGCSENGERTALLLCWLPPSKCL